MDIEDALNWLNELGMWAQLGVGVIATLLSIFVASIIMKKFVLDIVKMTSFEWDDQLYRPVSNRLYIFIAVVGTQLTLFWVVGMEHDYNVTLDPYFQATFLKLTI